MEQHPISIDFGSYKTRVGFESEDPPEFTFRTVIKKTENQEILIGENALKENQKEELICPVEKRLIVDWEGFENLTNHLFFNQLKFRSFHLFNRINSQQQKKTRKNY